MYLGRCGGTSTRCRASPWQQAPETAAAGCNPAPRKPTRFSRPDQDTNQPKKPFLKSERIRTRGGKQSSAARRGTENPPCVLVSDAVSVLQNMWGIRATRCLTVSPSTSPVPSSDPPRAGLAVSCKQPKNQHLEIESKCRRRCSASSTGTSFSAASASRAYTSSVSASACKNQSQSSLSRPAHQPTRTLSLLQEAPNPHARGG
jgi:hypothetical protein